MKKIFISLLAVAALAACTKSEVQYEPAGEIGFNVVAGNITKAVVDGTTYPTSLNMYVYAQTMDNTAATANYINNGEFTNKAAVEDTHVWGGTPNPYYWPNVKTLHFAGYSKSGNVNNDATPAYNCEDNVLTITNYNPGTETGAGVNDLMWFPTTELKTPGGFGKSTKFVPVDMYHTCSWITFIVKGDQVTSGSYKVTAMEMSEIDQTANVECSATVSGTTVTPSIVWTDNTDKTVSAETNYTVPVSATGITLDATGKNVETDAAYPATGDTKGNIVVIPQVPGKLSLTYTYKSTTNADITETVTGLDLALAKDASNAEGPEEWEAGKHYIYTITIKANEILIAPTPVDWTDSNWNITVE